MGKLIKPQGYKALLDRKQTEQGIKLIKEFFQQNISTELRLRRVTAPLFVLKGLGINDDLNGVERAVSFPIKDMGDARAEIVHSLAKWKRLTLIEREDRTLSFLEQVVKHIYAAILRTEYLTCESYPQLKPFLPRDIHFVHAQELLDRYPDLSPKEREDAICKEYGAVFVEGIGGKLSNGEKHDGRAPDYDDWSTVAANGYAGLNGDIRLN